MSDPADIIPLDPSPEGHLRWRVLIGAHPAMVITRQQGGCMVTREDGEQPDYSAACAAIRAAAAAGIPLIPAHT